MIEPHQTVVVEDGWQAEITAKNHLVLARVVALNRHRLRSGNPDLVYPGEVVELPPL